MESGKFALPQNLRSPLRTDALLKNLLWLSRTGVALAAAASSLDLGGPASLGGLFGCPLWVLPLWVPPASYSFVFNDLHAATACRDHSEGLRQPSSSGDFVEVSRPRRKIGRPDYVLHRV